MSLSAQISPFKQFKSNQMISKSQSPSKPILKTINSELDCGRASRRVSFSDSLFLQELKADGSVRLITEPFLHFGNEDNNLQNETRQFSRLKKKSPSKISNLNSMNYSMALNSSVKHTNVKRKLNDCDEDEMQMKKSSNNSIKQISSVSIEDDLKFDCIQIAKVNITFFDAKHSPLKPNIYFYFKPTDHSDNTSSQVSNIVIKLPVQKSSNTSHPQDNVQTLAQSQVCTIDKNRLLSTFQETSEFDEQLDSLFENLSNFAGKLNKNITNGNLHNFQSDLNSTNYKKRELEEQIEQAKRMMLEKSLDTDFVKGAVCEKDRIKDYFSQHNRNVIELRTFNKHITLLLDLKSLPEDEYSNITDMKLDFHFNKPVLKFWSDKFYLFYKNRAEHRNFIELLKLVLNRQFDRLKANLLVKYTSTEFLVNIEQEVEMMLERVSNFASGIKITTLKFNDYKFKTKQDDTFDLTINLFGIDNKLSVILNIDFDSLSVSSQFDCILVKMDEPDIKAIIGQQGINNTVMGANRLIRRLRNLYLERSFEFALQTWES